MGVIRSLRAHTAGEEVSICYANLSNPLLFRTYGFTLPPEQEPSWTCTLPVVDVVQVANAELAGLLRALPNVHLDAATVTDTLAAALEACRNAESDGAVFLHDVCTRKAKTFEDDLALRVALAALTRAQKRAQADGSLRQPWAWWAELVSEPAAALEEQTSYVDSIKDEAIRVKMSEYLCLLSHLEALHQVGGMPVHQGSTSIGASWGNGLQEDLAALMQAGLLRNIGSGATT